MSADSPLDPENRRLYGEMLRPPMGYALDCAAATTYSLDFETAMVIPATLAFHAAESRAETLASPLALLEGLERMAGRIAIFCEAGRIQGVPRQVSRLCALLEDTVTEVLAPKGGAFHPKLWLLRYRPLDPAQPVRIRLAILSRNLTKDTSWDLCLCLDGMRGATRIPGNEAMIGLLQALPNLAANRPTPSRALSILRELERDLETTGWTLPPGFDTIDFSVNGLGGPVWLPAIGRSIGVISPFCDPHALTVLTPKYVKAAHLVSRAEELALIPEAVRARFAQISVLDDLAETADGEDTEADPADLQTARGLHAKAFITERGWATDITVGSGNATSAALVNGSNVEVFATLTGLTSRIGSVSDHLSPDRLGRFLRPFEAIEGAPDDASEAAVQRLETARRAIASARFAIRCSETGTDRQINLELRCGSISPLGNIALSVWPLTLGEVHAVLGAALLAGQPVGLGTLALRDVTRWLGLRLTDEPSGQSQIFSLGANIDGLPEDRTSEILRSIIDDRGAFLRYLRLLLLDIDDPSAALFGTGAKTGWAGFNGSFEETPLLENMVRALSGDGSQLHDVARLIERLGDAQGEGGAVIPPEFLDLWQAFRAVMPRKRARKHV